MDEIGYGEQNPALAGRMSGNFPGPEAPTTPGPFAAGLMRNEGTIPGVGVAMPLSVPSLDPSTQGEQKLPLHVSMPLGAPPLPPGPHSSLLVANQLAYQQNAQQVQQQHQAREWEGFEQRKGSGLGGRVRDGLFRSPWGADLI
ncbi:hypothetical protein F0562_030631 [Nyssa sinensis]|uniref:Uncharacterized protein n=1 Tax=Nyssa sinensis TaxID=561372 RepID=A0A5J5AZC5_9ASTE|nr:hypothetical protein F0562_030631 [Nyssa sinensis]